MEPKKKKRSALMPITGLVMAGSIAVVAYFSAPILIDFLIEQRPDLRADLAGNMGTFEIVVTVFLWLTLFSLSMLVVAIAIGSDPVKDDTVLHPRPGDKKALVKYAKEMDKQRAKRDKLMQKKLEKEQRANPNKAKKK